MQKRFKTVVLRLSGNAEVSAARQPDCRGASFLQLWHSSIHSQHSTIENTKSFAIRQTSCWWSLHIESYRGISIKFRLFHNHLEVHCIHLQYFTRYTYLPPMAGTELQHAGVNAINSSLILKSAYVILWYRPLRIKQNHFSQECVRKLQMKEPCQSLYLLPVGVSVAVKRLF